MDQTNTTQEEVTTIANESPQQVVKKTTKQVGPQVQGQAPQEVYEKKRTIIRSNQIIWYILGLIEALLIFRLVLKGLGANLSSGFTSIIYAITAPLALPFAGILGESVSGNSLIEWSTVVAIVVYICIAWGVVYLIDLIYPITPKDVERS